MPWAGGGWQGGRREEWQEHTILAAKSVSPQDLRSLVTTAVGCSLDFFFCFFSQGKVGHHKRTIKPAKSGKQVLRKHQV